MRATFRWACAGVIGLLFLVFLTLQCSSDPVVGDGHDAAAGATGGAAGLGGGAGSGGASGAAGLGGAGTGGESGAAGLGGAGSGGTSAGAGNGGTSASGGSSAGSAGTATGSGGAAGSAGGRPVVGSCAIFPPDNAWNTRIDDTTVYPVDPASAAILAQIGRGAQNAAQHNLHADFGSTFGIPYVVVPAAQPAVPITFTAYGSESDPGPYPVPPTAPIEAGTDAHVLVLQSGSCLLYEMGNASYANPGWSCSGGARFDVSSNAVRTIAGESCPTSADAAGLSVFAGLVKYEEVARGRIEHAIRFTVRESRQAFVRPATHYASASTDASFPPMGMRVRLRAVPPGITGQARIVATALKEYGMILADNGSNWFLSGAPDPSFLDSDLDQLKSVPETDFDVVQMGRVYTSADCR